MRACNQWMTALTATALVILFQGRAGAGQLRYHFVPANSYGVTALKPAETGGARRRRERGCRVRLPPRNTEGGEESSSAAKSVPSIVCTKKSKDAAHVVPARACSFEATIRIWNRPGTRFA